MGSSGSVYRSVDQGDLESLKQFIQKHPNVDEVNKKNPSDESPLFCAIRHNNLEAVKFLIEQNCNVDDVNIKDNCTAAWLAASSGYTECLAALLLANCDQNKQCLSTGDTALIGALKNNHFDCVKVLLKAENQEAIRVDLNIRDSGNNTALMIAAMKKDFFSLEALASSPNCDINMSNNDGDTALTISTRNGCAQSVAILAKKNADLNKCDNIGNSPVAIAIKVASIDVLNILTQEGADVNIQNKIGETPLAMATLAQKASEEAITLLLHSKADVNTAASNGNTPLIYAAINNNISAIRLVTSVSSCDLDHQNNVGDNALLLAIKAGYMDVINHLLTCGADVNTRDAAGNTPAILACSEKISNSKKHLIIQSVVSQPLCDLMLENNKGDTVLLLLTEARNSSLIQLIMTSGRHVNPNKCNSRGELPLFRLFKSHCGEMDKVAGEKNLRLNVEVVATLMPAVFNDCCDVFRDCLRYLKCDLDVHDSSGQTVLIMAVILRFPIIIDLLIAAGCNPNIPDGEHRSPVHLLIDSHISDMNRLRENETLGSFNTGSIKSHAPSATTSRSISAMQSSVEVFTACFQSLVKTGSCDLNSHDTNGHTLIHKAVLSADFEALSLLMLAGADPNKIDTNGVSPINSLVAFTYEQLEQFDSALVCLPTEDERRNLKLESQKRNQILKKFERCLRGLTKTGTCDLNIVDDSGESILFGVIEKQQHGSAQMLKCLLSSGANPNVLNKIGNTPLLQLVSGFIRIHDTTKESLSNDGKNHDEDVDFFECCVEAVISAGNCEINALNNDGRSALLEAAYHINSIALTTMLEADADPNIQDKNGSNCILVLMSSYSKYLSNPAPVGTTGRLSIKSGYYSVAYEKCLHALSKSSCNYNAPNHEGLTAFSLADSNPKYFHASKIHAKNMKH